MILAWLLPVVLILRAGLVMAQVVDSTNLGINTYAKGEVSNGHLTKINGRSVQRGYNGWTRRRDGENARFEHRIKNGIWNSARSNERDPVREELVGSVGNKNQKKAVPILATDSRIVKKSVEESSPTLPSSPPSPQLSSPSPDPSSSSDTIPQKLSNSLPPELVAENSTRLNETTTNPTNTTSSKCSPNLPDYCINRHCTAVNPNCLIANGNARCEPRTLEGWHLSSCPESLSYTGPYRKENETCVLLTTPTDTTTLDKLLSVILKTTNATDGYSTNATDGYSTEPLKDYGNCDPLLYCDSMSTPSVCRPKLATDMECESSNQCKSGRCLEKQDGIGPKVCLGTNEGSSDQPSASSPPSSSNYNNDDHGDDSNIPAHSGDLRLILTAVVPVSVGILIIIFVAILVVRLRHREMGIRRRQVSYPKEIPFQDSPRTTWTNLTRSFTTIRESIGRFSQFSRTTDTDDRERRASVVEPQPQRRDSNRQSIPLPPPPKLTNSLMWMQTPNPLNPVYERIRALRSLPSPQQEDFGTAEQNSSGPFYTPAFASSSNSERIYQRYI